MLIMSLNLNPYNIAIVTNFWGVERESKMGAYAFPDFDVFKLSYLVSEWIFSPFVNIRDIRLIL